ncbi:MAG TPA: ABC transporter ATP-binding protein [Deltaproteobacteria bacterium]|nr:ABC transporter ATP-binding protein [Deltaproteobacteria bacterium]
MLRVKSIHTYYKKIRALSNVSLSVRENEIVALIGANGAGKSTLLNAISGVLPVAKGEISFDGKKLNGLRPEEIVAFGISQVPEGRQIFQPLTVKENLELGAYLRYRKKEKKEIAKDFERTYQLFPILEERKDQISGTLSGGEQQMLAIARALMARPRLLLLDEPSMGLAPKMVSTIMKTIENLRQNGLTILLVEQNAQAALKVADRGYVLETGRIMLEGDSRDLLMDNDVRRSYLGKDYGEFYE